MFILTLPQPREGRGLLSGHPVAWPPSSWGQPPGAVPVCAGPLIHTRRWTYPLFRHQVLRLSVMVIRGTVPWRWDHPLSPYSQSFLWSSLFHLGVPSLTSIVADFLHLVFW